MKLIERLYIAFYRYSIYQKERYRNRATISPRFDGIFIPAALTSINIVDILKLLNIKPFITTRLFDCFLILILLVSLSLYYFEKDSKYKEIVEKHNSPSELGKIEIIGWVYTILTVALFIYTNRDHF